MSQPPLFGTSTVNLLAEIGGQQVPLTDCDWVLWGPCGCPFGVTVGATKNGSIVHATEESAWRSFYDTLRDIRKALRRGEHLELITHARWSAEVADRMKVRCTHGDEPKGLDKGIGL